MWITEWTARAACKGTDPDELFVQGAAQNRAKLICRGCPVRTECLADALDNGIEFGVWGGMTERERRALLARRPDVTCWRQFLEKARAGYEQIQQAENVLSLRESSEADSAKDLEFEKFYEAEFTPLVAFLLKQGVPYNDVQDKAQATFAEAYMQWDKIEKPRAWIRTVAIRVNHRPRERPLRVVPSDYQEAMPDDIEIMEQTRSVVEALRTLAPHQRAVMAWTIDGFTPSEIAEHLDCEPAAVRKNLQRARENLKRTLRLGREEVI